jgi:hypothetical protein
VSRRWVAALALLVGLAGVVQACGTSTTGPTHRDDARAAGLGPIRDRLDSLQRRLRGYERTMARMDRWFRCVHHVPVDLVGDVQHRWGFHYDEGDGAGLDTRTALALHQGRGRPDLVLLRLSRAQRCLSRAPDPNGTGEDARPVRGRESGHQRRPARIGVLELRLRRLERRLARVEAGTERFDEWESCLSWLPVTEYGNEDQDLGYRVDDAGALTEAPDRHLPALDIDTSEWDDPDYEVLAFLGRDRPFTDRECGNEPGEGTDRPVVPRAGDSYAERLEDLRRGVRDLAEDVVDLLEPVLEFVQFDECMFTLGVQDRPGYRYRTPAGADTHRSALSFDMTGVQLPQFDVMAFPGEEPPQIECNEDAAGENTDE